MLRFLILFIIITAGPVPAAAQGNRQVMADKPILRVRISPDRAVTTGVWPQEQVILHIQLLSAQPFIELHLEDLEIAGAEVVTLRPPRTAQFENYGGAGWRHERLFALFPTSSGTITLPVIRASGKVERGRKDYVDFQAEAPIRQISVLPLPLDDKGESRLDPWLVSHGIEMVESWSKDPASLRQGDTIHRQIELTASGVRADSLPNLIQRQTPGMTVLANQPSWKQDASPEGITTRLHQSWDIRIDSEGPVHIAPLSLRYLDPTSREIKMANVKAVRVEPLAPNPAEKRRELMADAANENQNAKSILTALAAITGLITLLVFSNFAWLSRETKVDQKLKQALKDNPRQQDWYRAISNWAHANAHFSGELAPAVADRQRALEPALFANQHFEMSANTLSKPLIAAARRSRWRKQMASFRKLTDTLLGPPKGLRSARMSGRQ